MKIIPVECPKCGGTIPLYDSQKDFYCQYCGTKLHIDANQVSVNVTYKGEHTTIVRDEAKLRELEEHAKDKSIERELVKASMKANSFEVKMRLLRILLVILYSASWVFLFKLVDLTDHGIIPKSIGPYYLVYLVVFGVTLLVTRKRRP